MVSFLIVTNVKVKNLFYNTLHSIETVHFSFTLIA